MKNPIYIVIISLMLCSCEHKFSKDYFYETGILQKRRIYSNKRDSLNFQQFDYYPSGILLGKSTYKNGRLDGDYYLYFETGTLMEKTKYFNGDKNSISQKFDTLGRLAAETYFVNGKGVLYSEFYESKDKRFIKQLIYMGLDNEFYPIGSLVSSGDTILKELSNYAAIIGTDSISSIHSCFKIQIFGRSSSEAKFEITVGKPNTQLDFDEVDTCFISKNDEIQFCNFKLKRGINHLFGRVYVYDKDTASYYIYKDVYVRN